MSETVAPVPMHFWATEVLLNAIKGGTQSFGRIGQNEGLQNITSSEASMPLARVGMEEKVPCLCTSMAPS